MEVVYVRLLRSALIALATVVPNRRSRMIDGQLIQHATTDCISSALEDIPLYAREAFPQHQHTTNEVMLASSPLINSRDRFRHTAYRPLCRKVAQYVVPLMLGLDFINGLLGRNFIATVCI